MHSMLQSIGIQSTGTFGSGTDMSATELQHQPSVGAPRDSLRVVIVDDNKDAANGLARLLKTMGHEAHTVFESRSALRICLQVKPDLVLLDIGMPDLNGFDVCRLIRSEAKLFRVPIVAVTAFSLPEDRRKSAAAGFDVHLVKPVKIAELQSVLDSIGRKR